MAKRSNEEKADGPIPKAIGLGSLTFAKGSGGKRAQLDRAMSKLGFCSRTVAKEWIAAGRVFVNGVAASSPEQWVGLGLDHIEMAGGAQPKRGHYFLLHKPAGYVTTRSDELGRKTVYDLLPAALREAWLFPVGRLDRESEGLLLMTDDGPWADRLTDPAFHVAKTYRVKLDGRPRDADLVAFRQGMLLDGRPTLPAGVEGESGAWYRVTLEEGRNRQIRRMFHALGYKVLRLMRVTLGPLALGDLEPGGLRELERTMVERLRGGAEQPPRETAAQASDEVVMPGGMEHGILTGS